MKSKPDTQKTPKGTRQAKLNLQQINKGNRQARKMKSKDKEHYTLFSVISGALEKSQFGISESTNLCSFPL